MRIHSSLQGKRLCVMFLSQRKVEGFAAQILATEGKECGAMRCTWGAGANHWLGPAGAAAPAAGVAALRKFWLEVLPSLRMGVSCMAEGKPIRDVLPFPGSMCCWMLMHAESPYMLAATA